MLFLRPWVLYSSLPLSLSLFVLVGCLFPCLMMCSPLPSLFGWQTVSLGGTSGSTEVALQRLRELRSPRSTAGAAAAGASASLQSSMQEPLGRPSWRSLRSPRSARSLSSSGSSSSQDVSERARAALESLGIDVTPTRSRRGTEGAKK